MKRTTKNAVINGVAEGIIIGVVIVVVIVLVVVWAHPVYTNVEPGTTNVAPGDTDFEPRDITVWLNGFQVGFGYRPLYEDAIKGNYELFVAVRTERSFYGGRSDYAVLNHTWIPQE